MENTPLIAAASFSESTDAGVAAFNAPSEEKAQMLVVHVLCAELAEELAGAKLKAKLQVGKSPSEGVWWHPMVAQTASVRPRRAGPGEKPKADFDVAFAFPWHSFMAPEVHVELRKHSKVPCLARLLGASAAQATLALPSHAGSAERQRLTLADEEGRELGELEVAFELRSRPKAEVFERFGLLLADPDRYPHEQDYFFPQSVPALTPAEASPGAQAAAAIGEELTGACAAADGGAASTVAPTLLGRPQSRSPERKTSSSGARLRPAAGKLQEQ